MSKESIETLVAELVHEEDWRRMRATAACLAGGPRAVQALVEVLRSGSAGAETGSRSDVSPYQRSSGGSRVGRVA